MKMLLLACATVALFAGCDLVGDDEPDIACDDPETEKVEGVDCESLRSLPPCIIDTDCTKLGFSECFSGLCR